MVANEVFRARFRNSYEKPERVEPNKMYEYTIDLHSANHVFRPGHRVMVQVQSTWFPLIDRNQQTYVDKIYKATAADYQAATRKSTESPTFNFPCSRYNDATRENRGQPTLSQGAWAL